MSIFEIYAYSYAPVSIFIFYVLIAFLIAILIINNKLNNAIYENNIKKYNDNVEIIKGLIWSNYLIQLILFIFMFIGIYFIIKSPLNNPFNVTRRKLSIISYFAFFCMIIVSSGLTYYIHNGLNNMDIKNAKEEVNKIYIIIPIISIITIVILSFILGYSNDVLRNINYYINTHVPEPISVTRTNSPVSSNSPSMNDLPNRYSPSYSY